MYKNTLGLLCILSLGLSQSAIAYPRGCASFYVGGQLGTGNLHYDNSKFSKDAISVSDNGLAGRLLVGFNINQNLALETGYTFYKDPEFKFAFNAKTDFSQRSWDLLAKVSLPVSCNACVYAKGGMAYVFRDDAEFTLNNVILKLKDNDEHLRPVLGAGICYAFNCRVSGDIGAFRTFGTDDLEDMDFYAAGVTVKLG